jgi:hypothetical protein
VALLTALALPPLLIVALGAIQLQVIVSDRQATQDVADSAALWGAQQLTVTSAGTDQRTMAFADAQLAAVKANATVNVQAAVLDKTTVKVTIDTERPSFFMNLLPAGGFTTHVVSIAEGASQSPLCVLVIGNGGSDDLYMNESSRLQAPACLVHGNKAVRANGSALIQGQVVEAGTTASGPISPAASTGAPAIADPFASLNLNFPGLCLLSQLIDVDVKNSLTLAPGLHQPNYRIKNGATMTLQRGEHYFCGDLEMKNKANLIGDDVVLVFAAGTQRDWKDGGNVSLNGRKSGSLAGFVMMDSRNDSGLFKLNSDPISNVTGAIYVPNAALEVDGSKQAGTNSAWTVVAAKAFIGRNAANLVINANYGATDVPVPGGVGNKMTGSTHLK